MLLGDYHYPAHVEGVLGAPLDYVDLVTPLEGLRRALPGAVVRHMAGAPLTGDADPAELDGAITVARRADVASSAWAGSRA